MRIALRPSQRVPLIHASPLSCTFLSTALVVALSLKRKSTWFKTISFRISQPGSSASPSPKRSACRQQRSTRSATPLRPSDRSAAYTAKPRAARELGRPVDLVADGIRGLDEVVGTDRHRRPVPFRMGDEGDA